MPSGNVSKNIKVFILFSFQHHKADWIYALRVNIHHNLCIVEGEEEDRPGIPNSKFAPFPCLLCFLQHTNWLCEICSENEYPGHCSVVLCCEITSLNEEKKYWIPLKASRIISLKMKIPWKSQREEDWRGYESFISLNVRQAALLPLPLWQQSELFLLMLI